MTTNQKIWNKVLEAARHEFVCDNYFEYDVIDKGGFQAVITTNRNCLPSQAIMHVYRLMTACDVMFDNGRWGGDGEYTRTMSVDVISLEGKPAVSICMYVNKSY